MAQNIAMEKRRRIVRQLHTPTNRPAPTVATTDIGAEVARLLIAEWNGKRVIELGSPASPDDIARAMSEATGRLVRARAIPREQWSATLIAHGFPPGATWACEQMEDGRMRHSFAMNRWEIMLKH